MKSEHYQNGKNVQSQNNVTRNLKFVLEREENFVSEVKILVSSICSFSQNVFKSVFLRAVIFLCFGTNRINLMGKYENAGNNHFLHFSSIFQSLDAKCC